ALAPRLTGVIPGFIAFYVVRGIGVAGGVLLGLLLLSALTIVTIAWHPFLRLVKAEPAEAVGVVPAPAAARAKPRATEPVFEPDEEPPPFAPPKREKKPKKAIKAAELALGDPADDEVLPPVELLQAPPPQEKDAGVA